MTRNAWLVLAGVVILAGCRVGLQDDDDGGRNEDICESVDDNLQGDWRSACLFLEVRQNDDNEDENIFFTDAFTFDSDNFTRDYREFADIDCISDEERLLVSYQGTFAIGDNLESSEGLDVCEIDFVYDEATEERDDDDVFEEPDTPFDLFDLVFLPEPEDGLPRNLFTGDLDGGRDGTSDAVRPISIDFDVEYLKR